ncbi:peptidyl-alpha-hydroxyglycine alpha-amidating lyase 2-like [Teleopsis dalmanni]|uniref:peptidyl-alpha-hydroxyglycine alpha-amidating lyase 2-like n=1 Tax=Teleopsis dalmanni TaxID=139649 RepID=UPI0018CE380D|nr:peptidyl-alpha-hydroxyglycine alpha-amidating lyase 2-like [Teleopsis dalmanni]XP_037954150.1 peptidyl-alpha-hydroxyglycine alpha-amidating lyase 2-like [Teleopsis dalmanni]
MTILTNVEKLFGLLLVSALILLQLTAGNHLPSHRFDYPDEDLTINERFFNDVRALIKRRLKENAALQELHIDGANTNNNNNNEIIPLETSNTNTDAPPPTIPTPVLVENWPTSDHSFGQVTAVSIDPQGNPVIFHRADRYWDANTFNESNIFYLIEYGPIKEKTIYILDPKTGAIKSGWGEELFYMPHGLTIDVHGNYWMTDVAMHQAFKFKPFETHPQIIIGKRFQPGSSVYHLCKPTSIAVATTGEFFIADGYCNQRILKFNAAGRLLRTIPQPPEFLSLQVPHAITLLEHLDLLCIADRENMRVVCPKAGLKSSQGEGQPAATIQEPDLGRVFGVAAYGDIVYAVNGPTSMLPVRGFTIDPRSEAIIGHWGEFKNPHSVAVCVNGSALYVTEIGTNHQTNRIWKYVLV